MNTKDYLSRAFYANLRIRSKAEQIAEMKTLATKVTALLSDVRVQTTRNDHKMEDIIVKIAEYQDELCNDITELVRIKKEVKAAIDSVENEEYRLLLEMRYISNLKWEEIAFRLGYSMQHTFRLRDKALAEVDIQTKR